MYLKMGYKEGAGMGGGQYRKTGWYEHLSRDHPGCVFGEDVVHSVGVNVFHWPLLEGGPCFLPTHLQVKPGRPIIHHGISNA